MVFGGNVASWDLNKVRLLMWCRFYNSITYSYDVPPPDDVYENDWKLDAWVDMKKAERNKKMNESAGASNQPRDRVVRPNSLVDSYDSSIIKQ